MHIDKWFEGLKYACKVYVQVCELQLKYFFEIATISQKDQSCDLASQTLYVK